MNEKTNFAKIIDTLGLISALFLIFLAILKPTLKSNIFLFATAAVFALTASYLINTLIQKLTRGKILKRDEEKQIKKLTSTLQTANPTKLKLFWKTALSSKFTILKTTKNGFLITREASKIYFCYNFTSNEISLAEIITSLEIATKNDATLYFLGIKASKEAGTFCHPKLFIFDIYSTHKILKELSFMPKLKENPTKNHSFSKFLKLITQKQLTKKYIKLSILFYILSFLIPFKTYYQTFGIITLFLSIICLTKKETRIKTPSLIMQ